MEELNIKAIEYALRQLAPSADIQPSLDNLSKLFEVGTCVQDYFDLLGTGAFKEAYMSGIPGIVFKFCSSDNPTYKECEVINQSRAYGVEKFFCPTFFIEIPDCFFAEYLADSDTDNRYTYNPIYHSFRKNEDFQYLRFDYLEIQPLVKLDSLDEDDNLDYKSFDKLHMVELLSLYGGPGTRWAKACYDYYQEDEIKAFLNFCDKFRVNDLHTDNRGYLNGRPIILDWMSNPPV